MNEPTDACLPNCSARRRPQACRRGSRMPSAMRRGGIVTEAVLAAAILSLTGALVAQVVVTVNRQSRRVERRAEALQAAVNLLERAAAWSWEETTAEAAARLCTAPELSGEAAPPGVRIALHVEHVSAEPLPARRLELVYEYRDESGEAARPIRLTAIKYPLGGPPR